MADEDFDHWMETFNKMDQAVNQLVRAAAFKVEARAKSHAPVDTGFLRSSIYTKTENGGGFSTALASALSHRAKTFSWRSTKNQELNFQRWMEATSKTAASHAAANAMLFPEVGTPEHNEAWIAVGATYGIFIELGTSRMAARPYMTPALEAEREPFLAALRRLVGA